MNKSKALVTGSTGFVGKNLVRHLLCSGWEVHVILRPQSDITVLPDGGKSIHQYVYDGTAESMHDIMRKAKPDVVFHLASLFLSEHKSSDIEDLIKSNLLFGTQLVEAMVKMEATLLVNTGTSWQHYQQEAYNPVNLYAATKQAFSALIDFYVESCRLKVITLKLYETYGPNDARPKIINLLRRISINNEPLPMSPGEQLIDMVHVDDVASAYIIAANHLVEGNVIGHSSYAVSSGKPLKLRKLVERIEEIIDKPLPIQWGRRPYREREIMHPWKGDGLPGWSPKISLDEGLCQVFSRN